MAVTCALRLELGKGPIRVMMRVRTKVLIRVLSRVLGRVLVGVLTGRAGLVCAGLLRRKNRFFSIL